MPSSLFPRSIVGRRQQRALARSLRVVQNASVSAPWEGFTPDLPHEGSRLRFVSETTGLVAKADPSGAGEVLTNDAGFAQVDGDRLPLGSANGRAVVLLKDFPLTNNLGQSSGNQALQGIVLIAGDGSTAGSFEMYRLDPVTTQWTQIAWDDPGIAGDAEPSADRDGDSTAVNSVPSMADSAIFPGGCPNRSVFGLGAASNIDQPVFVWTNNQDPVQVYPSATGNLEYQQITDQFGTSTNASDFRCMSLEAFGDRVYYFNTSEGSGANAVRHSQRLRRSARGTADPAPAKGSGAIDIEQFSGVGLRVESLGDVLVCYFQDGVAFVTETSQSVAPNRVDPTDSQRGLLGTHSVCQISNNAHFGIFRDGWWFLDSSGRWNEAGVMNFDGKPVEKWRQTFYQLVDQNNLHRIQCHYDQERNWVRIVVPTPGTETTQTWLYDIDADRVWKLNYPQALGSAGTVTVWGEITLRSTAAVTWGTVSGTWSSITGSWGGLTAEAGNRRLVHGNINGSVYSHDEDLVTYDGIQPPWSYTAIPTDFGDHRSLKTTDRICVEHVNSGNDGMMNVFATTGRPAAVEVGTLGLNQGLTNDVELASKFFRITDEHVGFGISGSGPLRIRSFDMTVQVRPEVRRR